MITIKENTEGKRDKALVTFVMPSSKGYRGLYLIGWFDEWHESVYRMQSTDDGSWFLTLELESGCEYQYCFRTDDGKWLCDPDMPLVSYPFIPKNSLVLSETGPSQNTPKLL